jgi:hypothetical protein
VGALDLALDHRLTVLDLDLDRHRDLGQIQELGQQPRDLAVVAAHPLLTRQDQVHGSEPPNRRRQRPRGAQRVEPVEQRVLEVQRRIGPHREAVAKGRLRAVGPQADEHDLAPLRLLQAQRLLDRELVVGGDDPVDVRFGDRAALGGDLDAGLGVRNLLDANDDLHE